MYVLGGVSQWAAPVLLAVIALFGVLFIGLSLRGNAKKDRDLRLRLQKAELDSTLKAKNRLIWIREVRQATASCISQCFYLTERIKNEEGTDDNYTEEKRKIKEICSTLILCFGFDKERLDFQYDAKTGGIDVAVLRSVLSNRDKNEELVKLIKYIEYRCVSDRLKWVHVLKQYYHKRYERTRNTVFARAGRDTTDVLPEAANKNCRPEDSLPKKDRKTLEKLEKQLRKYTDMEERMVKDIRSSLEILLDAVRIYLKLEWDVAKEGK
ncbi:MAG: hypothetical protein ACK5MN_01995 [Lachnospiraceae bacterium]